jgi:hypothetical protein
MKKNRPFVYEQKFVVLRRVARFFMVKYTKTGKIYQITIKYTKWKQNRPKWPSSIARPSKTYPNWEFWFENTNIYHLATLDLRYVLAD